MITKKEIYEDYVNLATAAQMLKVSKTRINILCREGRFNGAFKAGWSWLIPRTAVLNFKPLKRGRKRNTDKILLEKAIAESNQWQNI